MTFLGVEKDENFGKTLISYQDLDHTKKARVICVSDMLTIVIETYRSKKGICLYMLAT